MADIFHDLPIIGSRTIVFETVSTPDGLTKWWANDATGTPASGAEYELQFGPDYIWRALITEYDPNSEFELEMTDSDQDWNGTRVGFVLDEVGDNTLLRFRHTGWPHLNDHCRQSSYCWAMYLRCLKRYVEQGIVVAYNDRFNG